jgi:hypothetical protein
MSRNSPAVVHPSDAREPASIYPQEEQQIMVEAINYHTGVENAWSNVATFVPKLLVFLIILVIGYIIAKAISKILSRVLQKVGFDRLVERGGVKKAL